MAVFRLITNQGSQVSISIVMTKPKKNPGTAEVGCGKMAQRVEASKAVKSEGPGPLGTTQFLSWARNPPVEQAERRLLSRMANCATLTGARVSCFCRDFEVATAAPMCLCRSPGSSLATSLTSGCHAARLPFWEIENVGEQCRHAAVAIARTRISLIILRWSFYGTGTRNRVLE
ncbi:hypothetical protein L228DRAFT_235663 [Xylona heveae TC161]|uniref:Uncharacterized protein n=1 Tax=Xylona heveae (strain CBS 132557 / TC161) TaxID=1328760 RepID=A0A165JTS4_XYLHT|nr:hypothetical protein L228DRAFT_235663 [Xylona heveae TC161]KZF26617.1 hypothetical protein L228DRAFT_235663 [Xylona heveae TC161]